VTVLSSLAYSYGTEDQTGSSSGEGRKAGDVACFPAFFRNSPQGQRGGCEDGAGIAQHSTVRMTMETYTQAIPERVRQAQERVSGQLLAAGGNVQLPVVVA
jgi:hypothetical protein